MKVIDAPISRVRLLEDRALVTRVVKLDFESGRNSYVVKNVSPILADKTLSVQWVTGDDLALSECRIVRVERLESEQSEQAIQDLADEVQELEETAESLSTDVGVARELELSGLFAIETWLKNSSEDVHWGRGAEEVWEQELELLKKRFDALQENRLQIQARLEEVSESLQKQRQQLAHKQTPSEKVDASLHLSFESGEANEVKIEIEYVVPSACWRPCYQARWTDSRLGFEMQACVWQNTGEDWSEVSLDFSTQRQALGISPPALSRDILSLRKKRKQVVVSSREESVIVKHQKASQVPGIDDGGEVLTLSAPTPTTVKSDGRPHRIPLFDFSSDFQEERLVLAELAECVLLNSKQTNVGELPLLPGPVELVKSNGLVGRTFLEHTSPGEEFKLAWGAETSVSVHRRHETGKEETSVMSSWKVASHSVKIHLRNQTTEPQEFVVRERVPVSELKEVKIVEHTKRTSEQKVADSDGFVEWNVRLGAQEQRVIELFYDVQKKKKVVDG